MAQSTARGGGRVIGEYSVGKQIGSGSFSVVWHARHRVHGTEVAIKEIGMGRLNKKLQESLMSEIFILKQINHPNIIRLHDIIEVPGKIHLVLEYCRGGDLFMYIQRRGRVLEATAKNFMQQLAAGLQVLRENNLIHRDLKPQNLLLSSNDDKSVLKIADFGFARSLQPRGLAETLCGSPLYMAPEIMQLQKYDAKADLWSVGAILFQLVTGKTPYTGNNQIQLLQNIIKSTELHFPQDIDELSSDCIDLCQKLLRRNPVERLTFDEFFNHPFLSQMQPSEVFSIGSLKMADRYREESSQDDCLPFLLDDDSSGPDGSPSYLRRKPSMKSACGFSLDSRRETVSNSSKRADPSSRYALNTHKLESSGFRIDNSRPANVNTKEPPRYVEQKLVSSRARVVDSLESIDQDYVLVSGPPLDVSSSSTNTSKPSQSPCKPVCLPPTSLNVNSRASAPVPIIGSSFRNVYQTGSLESQYSALPGTSATSQRSIDIDDMMEQASTDSMTRIRSLQQYASSIKELVNEKLEAGRHLEAFSIQLVILAIWKQALHIFHTQAVSSIEGSATKQFSTLSGSLDKKHGNYDIHEYDDAFSYQEQEDQASEIKREFFREVSNAEELSKFVEPGNTEMPDAMEIIYQSALALGRHGAVDELMGDVESAGTSYSKAVRLLVFLQVEAPSLILNPPFSLTNSDRFRLRTYTNILNDRQGHSRSQRMALLRPEDDQCPP
ncbi:Serine/threonine-protein kinase ATG1c [Ancistrocladus abbreviatus]